MARKAIILSPYWEKIRQAKSLEELQAIADSMTPEERAQPSLHFTASRALDKFKQKMWHAVCLNRLDSVSKIALRACGLAKQTQNICEPIYIRSVSCGDADKSTCAALKKAIEKYGISKTVYFDNGSGLIADGIRNT